MSMLQTVPTDAAQCETEQRSVIYSVLPLIMTQSNEDESHLGTRFNVNGTRTKNENRTPCPKRSCHLHTVLQKYFRQVCTITQYPPPRYSLLKNF